MYIEQKGLIVIMGFWKHTKCLIIGTIKKIIISFKRDVYDHHYQLSNTLILSNIEA